MYYLVTIYETFLGMKISLNDLFFPQLSLILKMCFGIHHVTVIISNNSQINIRLISYHFLTMIQKHVKLNIKNF